MRTALQSMLLSLLGLAPVTSQANAADITPADRALGEKFVYCGQLITAVFRANGSTEPNAVAVNMSILGSQLLAAGRIEQFKPYRDAAQARLTADMEHPQARSMMRAAFKECVQLNETQSDSLGERFKDQIKADLEADGARLGQ